MVCTSTTFIGKERGGGGGGGFRRSEINVQWLALINFFQKIGGVQIIGVGAHIKTSVVSGFRCW